MGKIMVDQLQRAGGDTFTMPMSASAGPLKSDATGQLSIDTVVGQVEYSKVFDFTANPVSSINILWAEIKAGVAFSDIAFIKMQGAGISSSAACQFKFWGLDSGNSAIQTGYLGYNYNGSYNGTQTAAQGQNSNQGYFQLPQYTQMAETGYTYGAGMVFDMVWHMRKDDSQGNYMVNANVAFQQNTSYSQPNTEQVAWDNYATSAPPASAEGGFRIEPTAGTINRGTLKVDLVLK